MAGAAAAPAARPGWPLPPGVQRVLDGRPVRVGAARARPARRGVRRDGRRLRPRRRAEPDGRLGLRAALDRRPAAVAAARPGVAAGQPDARAARAAVARCCARRPEQGLSPLPASARLLAGRAVPAGVRLARAGGAGQHHAAGAAHVLRRLPRGAPARRDVLRLALVRPGRRLRGVLHPGRADVAVRSPRRRPAGAAQPARPGVAGTPVAPGLFAVVGVLLGSTAYDSFSSSPWWVGTVQESSVSPAAAGDAGAGRQPWCW